MRCNVTHVEDIENAVKSLPERELARFRRWFAKFDAAAWDEQLERDVASGKLDELAEEALEDYNAGKASEI